MEFKEIGLSDSFVKSLKDMDIVEPTEIQEKTIPLALKGRDIIGGSATGSGKTLAFAAPIIENLKKGKGVQSLILTPTRELANQISTAMKKFSKSLNILAVYGGTSIDNQIKNIPKADVVVGTPGRILDHLDRETLGLRNVKFLVLDEVDRMFDMGFKEDVEKIILSCPKERQTMLFSATISGDIDHLSKKHTKNAKEVAVKSYVDASKLEQVFYDVPDNQKFSLLVHLLKNEKSKLVMVFCSTRRNVDFVAKNLKKNKIHADAIHGGLSQNKRTRVLKDFHDKNTHVLVCTDVAARGLDIQNVSHVYNYDLPNNSEEYIHRIGRTARAGKEGKAINILASRDYESFTAIQRDRSLNIEREKLPSFERVRIETGFDKRGGRKNFSKGRNFRDSRRGDNRRSSGRGRTGSGRSFRNNSDDKNSGSRQNNRRGPRDRSSPRGDSRRSSPRGDSRRSSGNTRSFNKKSSQRNSGKKEGRSFSKGRSSKNHSRSSRDGR